MCNMQKEESEGTYHQRYVHGMNRNLCTCPLIDTTVRSQEARMLTMHQVWLDLSRAKKRNRNRFQRPNGNCHAEFEW
jgi:hypothetical protein